MGRTLRLCLFAAVGAVIGWSLTGCAYSKAVDTTEAVRAVTQAQSHVTYTMLPGELTNDPALAGRIVAIPIVPGKNTTFEQFYADGQLRTRYKGEQDVVTSAVLSGAAGIDAGKAAEAAAEREFWREQLAEMRALAREAMTVAMTPRAPVSNANGAGGTVPPRRALALGAAGAAIDALRARDPMLAEAADVLVQQYMQDNVQGDMQAQAQEIASVRAELAQLRALLSRRPPPPPPASQPPPGANP